MSKVKWTIFLSGGAGDNSWNYEAEIKAENIKDAIDIIEAEDGRDCQIDGIIRSDILETFC